jgi:hypothetical protein
VIYHPVVASPLHEIDELFRELDLLLKNPEAGAALAEKGVNVSLALVAKDGLLAYLKGEKARAAEDFATFSEEVFSRIASSGYPGKPS